MNLSNISFETPFSERLNLFVLQWFEQNKHLFTVYPESQFDFSDITATYEFFVKHYKEHGTIPMWYDDNRDNIFASREVNAKFRAWHDYTHVITGNDFSLLGEVNSFQSQQKALPEGWDYERQLMEAEIVGQAMHYSAYPNIPIESQRAFTAGYLNDWGYVSVQD